MVLIMTVVVYFLYPETKGLAIEDTPKVFKKHWFWKHYANAPDRTLVSPSLCVLSLHRSLMSTHELCFVKSSRPRRSC